MSSAGVLRGVSFVQACEVSVLYFYPIAASARVIINHARPFSETLFISAMDAIEVK